MLPPTAKGSGGVGASHFLSRLLEVDMRMGIRSLRGRTPKPGPSPSPSPGGGPGQQPLPGDRPPPRTTACSSVTGSFDLISSLPPGHQKFKGFLFFYCNSLEGR